MKKALQAILTLTLGMALQAQPQVFRNNGLVAFYPSKGNGNDASGNNINGTMHGATLTTDRFGYPNSAWLFDGVSAFIDFGHPPALALTRALTLTAWIEPQAGGGFTQMIADKEFEYQIALRGGSLACALSCGGVPETWSETTVAVPKGVWTHVALVYDGAKAILFTNGASVASFILGGPITNSSPGYSMADFTIGSSQIADPTHNYFSGAIDDVRLYNRALSDSEVRASASASPAAAPQNSNFSDASTWTRHVLGSGVQLTPAGNGFEVDYAAGTQPGANNAICGGYMSTFALRGDFTLDIDYTLKTWPASGGVRLGLGVWPHICMIRQGQGPYTQEWHTFGAGPYESIPTDDRHGTLRLVRAGGTLQGYYKSLTDGSWVLVGSRSGDPVFLQDFQVSVQSWTDGSTFGGQPVAITLGNFVMTADTVLPGPYGIPSWKAAPGAQQVIRPAPFSQLNVAPPPSPRSFQPLPSAALPAGILDEDLNLDLSAAIQSYQTLVTQFDAQRALAANAIFRLAECYRRLGRTDEARSQYARILREFSDQAPLVSLCRKYLASLTAQTTFSNLRQAPIPSPMIPPIPNTPRPPLLRSQYPAPTFPSPGVAPMPPNGFSPATRLPDGLVGFWAGEGNANDSTGANNGVLEGGVTFVPGKVGRAFSLDGITADVRVPASPSLDVGAGTGMTIAAWIRPADLYNERCVVEWNYEGFGTLLNISVTAEGGGVGPGAFTANFKDINLQHHLINSPPGVLTTNRFQHLAATYDGRSGDAVLYLDGAIVAQANLGVFTPRTIGDLYFGVRRSEAGGVMHFVGQIDEVAVYSRALSEAEIETVHVVGGAGKHPVPAAPLFGTGAAPLPAEAVSPEPQLAQAQSMSCLNNLKELGISFKTWALDNRDKFPFSVPTNEGGTLELCARGDGGFDRNSFSHFMVMSNELSTPRILVCPADSFRQAAADFVRLRAVNVTYQVRSGPNVNQEHPQEVLVRCPIHGYELLCDASVRQGRPH